MEHCDRLIDRYYPAGTLRRDIYLKHCRSVAALAIELNNRLTEPLPVKDVEEAAMIHDIGICLTDAPSIGCFGKAPYIAHGVLGAELLRKEGYSEQLARVAERHTGAGLTAEEIRSQRLPLPERDMLPETMLEKLICYADKFYSKGGDFRRKPFDAVRASMARHGNDSLQRFDALHALFHHI